MINPFRQLPVDSTIADLLVGITGKQRVAIINLVLGVASCDHPANEDELALLQTYQELLNVPRVRSALIQLDTSGISGMVTELNRLSKNQKELVVLLINHMICVDEPANEAEFSLATYFFEAIGIPVELYVDLVEKASRSS